MKQLFRNGEQITISPNVATAVNYSNSTSGLVASTVQDAIDEISNELDFINVGEDINGTTIHEKLDMILAGIGGGSATEIEIVPLVPTLTSNTGSDGGEASANTVYGNSGAWCAFDGNTSTQWVSNDYATTGNNWIQYKFTVPTNVSKVTILPGYATDGARVKNFTVQASNDGTDFVDIYTGKCENGSGVTQHFEFDNNKFYLYYRLKVVDIYTTGRVQIEELQFYGYQMEALVPAMTSDTAPSGFASASSVSGSFNAWKAFNGTNTDQNDCWLGTGAGKDWIQYVFTKPVIVKKLLLANRNYSVPSGIKGFTLQGSSNGGVWTDIKSFINENNTQAGEQYFDVSENTKEYSHYRLNITSVHNNYASIAKLQFYAAPEGTVTGGDSKIEPKTIVKNTNIATSHSFDVEVGKTYMLMFTGRADLSTDSMTVTGGDKLFYEVAGAYQATSSMTPRVFIAKATESTMTFDATSVNIFYPVLICLD